MTAQEAILLLREWHLRHLRHISSMGLYGWEEFRDTDRELEDWGLIHGEWFGSLEWPARPVWRATRLGELVLRELDTRKAS